MSTTESQLEQQFIEKLRGLKYEYRPDNRDRAALGANFRRLGDYMKVVGEVKSSRGFQDKLPTCAEPWEILRQRKASSGCPLVTSNEMARFFIGIERRGNVRCAQSLREKN